MKCKRLLGMVFTLCITFSLVLVFGCKGTPKGKTPPPAPTPLPSASSSEATKAPPPGDLTPFTIGILNRLLNEAEDFNINQCQFFLSGGIIMERNDEEKNQRAENGTVVFIDTNNRKEIIINDKTEGAAFRLLQNQNEVALSVGFDQDDRCQLLFSAAKSENSQFFLRFTPQHEPPSDARGNLIYGGQRYKLKFSGGIPYLMIRLSEIKEPIKNQYDASGRRASYAGRSSFESSVPLTTDILNRMRRSYDFSIGQYQFYISGAVTLERFDNQQRASVIDGAVIFEDNPASWYITVKDRTEGLAIGQVEETRDEIGLFISFDQDERYQFLFSASAQDPQSQFFLKFNPLNDPHEDARGYLEYAGQDYRLKFSGGRPHLRISLRKEGGDSTEQHTVPGRKIR